MLRSKGTGLKKIQKVNTTKECIAAKTITSNPEGFNPFPKITDFLTKSSFNSLRALEHCWESTRSPTNPIHFITCNKNSTQYLASNIKCIHYY